MSDIKDITDLTESLCRCNGWDAKRVLDSYANRVIPASKGKGNITKVSLGFDDEYLYVKIGKSQYRIAPLQGADITLSSVFQGVLKDINSLSRISKGVRCSNGVTLSNVKVKLQWLKFSCTREANRVNLFLAGWPIVDSDLTSYALNARHTDLICVGYNDEGTVIRNVGFKPWFETDLHVLRCVARKGLARNPLETYEYVHTLVSGSECLKVTLGRSGKLHVPESYLALLRGRATYDVRNCKRLSDYFKPCLDDDTQKDFVLLDLHDLKLVAPPDATDVADVNLSIYAHYYATRHAAHEYKDLGVLPKILVRLAETGNFNAIKLEDYHHENALDEFYARNQVQIVTLKSALYPNTFEGFKKTDLRITQHVIVTKFGAFIVYESSMTDGYNQDLEPIHIDNV